MFTLVLTFWLTTAPTPTYAQRHVEYRTAAECQAARLWWMANTDSQLPDMNPAYELLIGPSCHGPNVKRPS